MRRNGADNEAAMRRAIGEALPRVREQLLGLSPAVTFAVLGECTAQALNALPVADRQRLLGLWVEAVQATVRPY